MKLVIILSIIIQLHTVEIFQGGSVLSVHAETDFTQLCQPEIPDYYQGIRSITIIIVPAIKTIGTVTHRFDLLLNESRNIEKISHRFSFNIENIHLIVPLVHSP